MRFLVFGITVFLLFNMAYLPPRAEAGGLESMFKPPAQESNRCLLIDGIYKSLHKVHPDLIRESSPIFAVNKHRKDVLESFVSFSNPRKSFSLKISKNKQLNSFAQSANYGNSFSASITISTRLLSLISNESELAFVLAHEISHLTGNHFFPNTSIVFTNSQIERVKEIRRGWESLADKEALLALRKAGIETSHAQYLLKRLQENRETDTHEFEGFHLRTDKRIAILDKLAMN